MENHYYNIGGDNLKTINATMSQMIKIGHQGENKAVQVSFDLTPFHSAFSGGHPQLVVRRPGDQSGYPVALIIDGSKAIWIVSASDTEKSGNGQCELQWFVGDVLAKSDKYNYIVYAAIPSDAEPPDAPSKAWFAKILSDIGDLSDLDTEAKENLVAAINEARQAGGGGAGGTSDHQKLSNRDAADQHPIAAITGLEAALDGKQPTGNYLTNEALAGAVDDALAQAKESGEFDGADGKTAYQYAQDGGYTGTEAEFAEKMAAEIPAIDNTLSKAGQAADAAKVGEEISSLSGKIAEIPSGKDGADGQDGITPTIGDNGNWYLGDTDTGKPSRGETGPAGADGKDGAPGADGHTPVKGTDYWTAEDQQAIVSDVLADLPTWEGGSY